ncbi:hypothetical protein ES703_00298 [subsurface metagenome]
MGYNRPSWSLIQDRATRRKLRDVDRQLEVEKANALLYFLY